MKTEINKMIDYCDKNIIDILLKETLLKPYEVSNKLRLNQLMLVREFLYEWKKIKNYKNEKS